MGPPSAVSCVRCVDRRGLRVAGRGAGCRAIRRRQRAQHRRVRRRERVEPTRRSSSTSQPACASAISVQVHIRPWFRLPRPNAPGAPAPDWSTELYSAGIRYERPGNRRGLATRVDFGYNVSPIGLGIIDTRPSLNPVIAPHVSYLSPMPAFDLDRAARVGHLADLSARRSGDGVVDALGCADGRDQCGADAQLRARPADQSASDAGIRRRRRRDAVHRPAPRHVVRPRTCTPRRTK